MSTSTSTSTPIPIITVGQHAQIATYMVNALKPEYEVIHTIISLSQGIAELPLLVNRQENQLEKSSFQTENFGSGNYARKAVAIAIGGGYDDEKVGKLMSACGVEDGAGTGKGKRILWLRAIPPKQPPTAIGEEFMRGMVGKVKSALGKLGEEGRLSGGEEGVVWF